MRKLFIGKPETKNAVYLSLELVDYENAYGVYDNTGLEPVLLALIQPQVNSGWFRICSPDNNGQVAFQAQGAH